MEESKPATRLKQAKKLSLHKETLKRVLGGTQLGAPTQLTDPQCDRTQADCTIPPD